MSENFSSKNARTSGPDRCSANFLMASESLLSSRAIREIGNADSPSSINESFTGVNPSGSA